MKVFANVMSYAKARTVLVRRNCWTYCHECRVKWSQMQPATINVHRIELVINGSTATRFCCDACLPVVEEKANLV